MVVGETSKEEHSPSPHGGSDLSNVSFFSEHRKAKREQKRRELRGR
jgi:hypothetical protein